MSQREMNQAVTGGVVQLRASIEEDPHLATYITEDGKRLHWVAPFDANDIETAYVQLLMQYQNLSVIQMHPDDFKAYTDAVFPAHQVFLAQPVGRKDRVLQVLHNEALSDFINRYMQRVWPKQVFHREEEGDRVEVLVYRDSEALNAWERSGCTPETDSSMVHFVFTPHELTIVGEGSVPDQLEQAIQANRSFW